MGLNFEGKDKVAVTGVTVAVLGGRFSVSEVLLPAGVGKNALVDTILATPTDRWFVILGKAEEPGGDLLAVVDDDLEFQTMALGKLQNA